MMNSEVEGSGLDLFQATVPVFVQKDWVDPLQTSDRNANTVVYNFGQTYWI